MTQDNLVIESKNTFGGWFEDFEEGQIFKHWPGKTITEMDNHLFSLLTMNEILCTQMRITCRNISTEKYWLMDC